MKQLLLPPLPEPVRFEVKRNFREIFDASREYLHLRWKFIWLCVRLFVIPVAFGGAWIRTLTGPLYEQIDRYSSGFNSIQTASFAFLYFGGLFISLIASSLIVNADRAFTKKSFQLWAYAKMLWMVCLKLFLVGLVLMVIVFLLYSLTNIHRAIGLSVSILIVTLLTPVLYLGVAFWLSRKWEPLAVLFRAIKYFIRPEEWVKAVLTIGICVVVYMYATAVTEIARSILEFLLREFTAGGSFIVPSIIMSFLFNFFSYTVNLVLGVVLSLPIVYCCYSAYAEDSEHYLVAYLFSKEKLEGLL